MICPRCSYDVLDSFGFCPGCGLQFSTVSPAEPGPAPAGPTSHQPPSNGVGQPPAQTEPPMQHPPIYQPQAYQQGYTQPPPGGWMIPAGGGGYHGGQAGTSAGWFDRGSLFLVLGIIYVGIYFLVSIAVILFGQSAGSARAVGIIGEIGFFAAVAVPGYVLMSRGRYNPVGLLSMLAAAAAALFAAIASFTVNTSFMIFVVVITAIAFIGAQSCLILLMDSDRHWFRYVKAAAIAIAWLAGLVVAIVSWTLAGADSFTSMSSVGASIKAMGVFLLMDLCATIASILVWRLALKMDRA